MGVGAADRSRIRTQVRVRDVRPDTYGRWRMSSDETKRPKTSASTKTGAKKLKKYASAPDKIDPAEAIKLWTAGGGRCAFCGAYLLENATTGDLTKIGELAHIVGRSTSPNSPRGVDELPVEERNLAANLILACPNDHSTIDEATGRKVWEKDNLRQVKQEHEDRVRELTGLKRDRATTVIRAIGPIRGQPPSATQAAVWEAIHADLRFPQYGKLRTMATDLEIDLGINAGESDEDYFASTEKAIARQLNLVAEQIAADTVAHISVFAFGRIPALVQLGHHLGDKWDVELYDRHRNPEGWTWPDDGDPIQFSTGLIAGSVDDTVVTLTLSLSGHVQLADLPAELRSGATYEMTPMDADPIPGLVRSRETLRLFSGAYARFLAAVERDHPEATAINLVPAVGLSCAVELGRRRNRVASPTLRIWDRSDSGGYDLATEVG